jgi:hypothetical protein
MIFAVLTCAALLMNIGTPAMAHPPAWIVAQQQAWLAAEQQRQAAWLAARRQAAWLEWQQRAAWHAARRQAMEQAALQQAAEQAALQQAAALAALQQAAEQAALQEAPRALVTLVNPQRNGMAVNYSVDGLPYSLSPRWQQALLVTTNSTIVFHRGGELGKATYRLPEGTYNFVLDAGRGWDLLASGQSAD